MQNQSPYSYDNGIVNEYCSNLSPKDPTVDFLKALYYRARIQSTVWDLFTALVSRGFLLMESLRKPVTIAASSEAVAKVTWLLETFKCLSTEPFPRRSANPPHHYWEDFSTGECLDWLATIIVRGCTDVVELFDNIEASLLLGSQMEDEHKIYMEHHKDKTFVRNPDERVASRMPLDSPFGFWLPHRIEGGSEDDFAKGIRQSIG